MVKQHDLDSMYMEMAYDVAKYSNAQRRKVGAILVTPEEGRFEGINGMPVGFDNDCEFVVHESLVTKPEVLHAESNAIMKVARSHASSIGATMYCTLSPCLECAKLIVQAGVVRVVYAEVYPVDANSTSAPGVAFLQEAGIQVDKLPVVCHDVVDDEVNFQDEGLSYDSEDSWRVQ